MAKETLIAIVGCGAIGRVHARAVHGMDNARLVAVSDIRTETVAGFAKEFNCNAYYDYVEMFDREKPDLVCVCTPSGTRLDICHAAAERGVNLLVEKPLDIVLSRTKRVIDVCEEAGIKLGCVFQLRFMPVFRNLKKAVTDGRFGRCILGNAYTICYRSQEYYDSGGWRGTVAQDGGGALMNQGIHSVDLLRWIMGDVKSVFAYKASLTHDIEVEDTVTAVLRFESGAMGTLEATTSVQYGIDKRIEVYGTEGTGIIEGDKLTMWRVQDDLEVDTLSQKGSDIARVGLSPSGPLIEEVWLHQQQLQDMIVAIQEDRSPAIPGFEGHKAVELVLAIYESAETGKEVVLPLTSE
jgi:UDP-N-acetyl-2-amino-2-deoxyglucuronate dehydrogenase